MRVLGSPALWLPVALLALAYAGSLALETQACVALTERDRSAYGHRPLWQARFDALSATTGAGLLLFDLNEQYTPLGRWTLVALGFGGTLLSVAAVAVAWRRLFLADAVRLPHVSTLVGVCAIATLIIAILGWFLKTDLNTKAFTTGGPWHATSAFLGLGLAQHTLSESPAAGALALFAACGAAVSLLILWLLVRHVGPLARRATWICSATAIVYIAVLLGAAGLVAVLDGPRGATTGSGRGDFAGGSTPTVRYDFGDRARQALVAAQSGIPPQPIADRGISEGSKLVYALLLALGAPGIGGGLTAFFVVIALAPGLTVRRDAPAADAAGAEGVRRLRGAAVGLVSAGLALTVIVGLGLLVIETQVSSQFEAPATLGDALVDAASATHGGGLTSGLTRQLTSAHLSRGMGQNVDSYMYATIWLMVALLAGRVLPVIVLSVAARRASS